MKIINYSILIISFFTHQLFSQGGDFMSVGALIDEIDQLMGNPASSTELGSPNLSPVPYNPSTFDRAGFNAPLKSPNNFPPVSTTPYPISSFDEPSSPPSRSFRVENELMPANLRNPISSPTEENMDPLVSPFSGNVANPGTVSNQAQSGAESPSSSGSDLFLPKIDYKNANLEELMNPVDTLELPEFEAPIILPPEDKSPAETGEPSEPLQTASNSDAPNTQSTTPQQSTNLPDAQNYIVLGERIDQELRGKIHEAVMSTRLASGGSNNPFVTRSVFKAVANCNRVLGRLNAPFQKRYRRDVLLSLVRMHERNNSWVDAIKSYERYIEEFAADDSYPFEEHEDAPGIPDLQASVGSLRKWKESIDRGAPTIPETHVRMGKIYRSLGAHRMALNKFYDAINATLTLPKNQAFELADRRSGRSLDGRSDAESNQAMFEIAETFMDAEDYDQAVKFYDRLWRLEQLRDFDRAIVRFKQGLAHYRRAIENLRKEQKNERTGPDSAPANDLPFDKTPRADFAKVKEVLRGYGTIYPQSPYVPESHYILALTFEQLNQDEESINELTVLLKEADFHPEKLKSIETDRAERDRNYEFLRKMRSIWNFWKKKTGNYLANKFFEDSEYFNAYRVYSAMRKVDSSPSWQVPVLYQIALCQEKLGNFVQATETYMSIEEFVGTVKEAREDLANSEYLNFVFGMAKWRREQLEETRSIRQAVKRYGIYQTSDPADPALSSLGN
jgi:tetratricopeptide (TPR) repeat protein